MAIAICKTPLRSTERASSYLHMCTVVHLLALSALYAITYFSGLAMLTSQKWWFSVALLGAPVKGMYREENFSCFAQERGSRFSGLTMLASQK